MTEAYLEWPWLANRSGDRFKAWSISHQAHPHSHHHSHFVDLIPPVFQEFVEELDMDKKIYIHICKKLIKYCWMLMLMT